MIFNPFTKTYISNVEGITNIEMAVDVDNEAFTLQSLTQHIWEDSYDDLETDLLYYGLPADVYSSAEWKLILDRKLHWQSKNILLSLFTTNDMNCQQFVQFMYILAGKNHQYEQMKIPIDSIDYKSILNDVNRTYRNSVFFKDQKNVQRLTNILIAYANTDHQLFYGQGMNFIAAGLLYVTQTDENAIYDILRHIMIDKEWRTLFIDGTPGLFLCIASFNYKLKKKLPKLVAHFKDIGIEDLSMLINHYYLTLFMQNCPLQFSLIVISMFLIQGETILTKILIAIFKYFEKHLLSLHDFQKTTDFIKKYIVVNFFKELQKARKEEKLVKVLLNIGLLKKLKNPSEMNEESAKQHMLTRIITKPFRIIAKSLQKHQQ